LKIEIRDCAPNLVRLPHAIPANMGLVVSALPGRPWNDLKKHGWPVLTMEPLTLPNGKPLSVVKGIDPVDLPMSPVNLKRRLGQLVLGISISGRRAIRF
jgi:hypothetical protein